MRKILDQRPLENSARPPDSARRKHSRHPRTEVHHGASIAPSCGPAQALSSHSMVPPTPVACRTRIATTVRRTAANGGAPLAYLDRTASMASAPKDTQSPCFAYHPYGALSDLHVEVLLNAVLCRPPPR